MENYNEVLECLVKLNNLISINEIIIIFNNDDVEYEYMNDLEMYIYYISNYLNK